MRKCIVYMYKRCMREYTVCKRCSVFTSNVCTRGTFVCEGVCIQTVCEGVCAQGVRVKRV